MTTTALSPVTVVELVMVTERERSYFQHRNSRELAVDVIGALRLAGYLREGL